MRQTDGFVVAVLAVLATVPGEVRAGDAPACIEFQGFLTDLSGAPVNASLDMSFALHGGSSGGTALYEQRNGAGAACGDAGGGAGASIEVAGGFFSVALAVPPAALPADVDAPLYLEVSIHEGSGTPIVLEPRFRAASVPFAYRALECSVADDAAALGGTPASEFVTASELADGDSATTPVRWEDIAGRPALTGGGGGSGIKVLNAANLDTIEIADGDLVQIEGTITLSADYNRLDRDGVKLFGGEVVGSGAPELSLGDGAVVTGTSFRDLEVDGNDVLFEGCTFAGAMAIASGSVVHASRFNGVTQSTVYEIGVIDACEIDGSSLLRVGRLTGSDVSDSTLSGDAQNGNSLDVAVGNKLSSTRVYIRSDTVFASNRCRECKLEVLSRIIGAAVIDGNVFDNLMDGEDEILSVDGSGDHFRSITVTGNHFYVQPADPRSIRIFGDATATYQALRISGNNFIKGTRAIEYQGSLRTVVTDNIVHSTALGVSTGTNVVVGTNFTF